MISTSGQSYAVDLRDDFVERHLAPFGERVGRVAPGAAQVAGGQAHEHARPPGVGRFPLDGVEDLVDGQHCRSEALYLDVDQNAGSGQRRLRSGHRRRLKYAAMAKADLLLEAHLNHLPQRQKFSGAAGIDVDERDINKEPPDRAFLEQHIDAGPLPGLREHAEPGVQAAAAAAIEERGDRPDDGAAEPDQAADPGPRQHGHLRIRQGRVREGLKPEPRRDMDALTRDSRRHVRLELSVRQGNVERHLLSAQPARRPRGAPKFDELAFYAEHFDTVEVNSTFYRVPAVAAVAEVGRADARRVSSSR